MKTEKRIRIVTYILVILGSIVVGVIPKIFNFSQGLQIAVYVGWFFIILLLAMNVNLIWSMWMIKKIKKAGDILTEENDPDRYIAEMNRLLKGTKSAQYEQLRLLNVGAAYCYKDDFLNAKETYKKVKVEKLTSLNQIVYWGNLALVHFNLEEMEEACAIMEQQQEVFGEYRENLNLKNLLIILDIHWEIAKGNKDEAKKLIAKYRPEIENERNKSDFEKLERRANS